MNFRRYLPLATSSRVGTSNTALATALAMLIFAGLPAPALADDPGYALRFDGVSDFVRLAPTASVMGANWTTMKTVSLWVKPTGVATCSTPASPPSCDVIFGDRPRTWGMSRGVIGGQDRLWVWNYDGTVDSIGIPYVVGEWVHLALVHSGSVLAAYKNGALVGSVASGATPVIGAQALHVGGVINSTASNSTFQGDVDEVQIWNTARSAVQILQDMNHALTGGESGLAAYYRMSNGSGTALTDDSGHGWTGTLNDGGSGVPADGPIQWVPSGAFGGGTNNNPPVANGQSVTTPEDTAAAITLTASDADGNPLTFQVIASPLHGTLTGTAPTLTYTPVSNYSGPDSFTFVANDGQINSTAATVSLTVTSVNDPPVATGQSVTSAEDTAAGITLAGSDVDGNPLTFQVIASPLHGTLSGTAPTLTYTPVSNYSGTDSFTFVAHDGQVNSAAATVSLTVTPVNDPPVAVNDTAATAANTQITVPVLSNDNDADGDALNIVAVGTALHGAVTFNAASVTYTPDTGYAGSDQFSYTASDAAGATATAQVSMTVTPAAPNAGYALRFDGVSDFVRLSPTASMMGANWTTTKTVSLWVKPTGVATCSTPASPPACDAVFGDRPRTWGVSRGVIGGQDRLWVWNYDGTVDSIGIPYVVGEWVHLALVHGGSVLTAYKNGALVGSVASGATPASGAQALHLGGIVNNAASNWTFQGDIDEAQIWNTARSAAQILQGMNQSLTGSESGLAAYYRMSNGSGTALTDDSGHGWTGTLNDGGSGVPADGPIQWVPSGAFGGGTNNNPPVANGQAVTTPEDTAAAITLTASDADGNPLTFQVIASPLHGTLTGTAPTLTYTPVSNYSGADSFTFVANDGQITSTAATVSLTVTPVNDPPIANGQSVTTAANVAAAITLTGSDVDGNPLTFQVIASPLHGTLSGTAPTLTYTPVSNYSGADSFTFVASDGQANSTAAIVSLSILLDTTAPTVSGVSAVNITSSSATIQWTTNEAASSRVEYGPTTAYGQSTPLDSTLLTAHAVPLTGLAAATTYNYRVRSIDAAGNEGFGPNATVTTSPAGQFGVFQNEVLISGMNLPTAIKFLANGDMLVLELGGKIWKVPAGTTQVNPVPVLTLTNIGTLSGQQGLMDLTLDPNFATNRYYYVFYTLGSPNHDRASRFTANADFSATIAGSELVLYQDPSPASSEHHGGALNFLGDGKLYITTGEHFDSNKAQMLNSPRGKLLRINSDGTVPTDNPFYDGAGPNYDAIWALGLRNPFRASYDATSDRLLIGDVGGNNYATAQEEVHLATRGANYGWPICEGFSCGSNPTYTSPLFTYPHNGRDASITGGFVYRGSQFPASYYGSYFYADYAQNWIRRLTFNANGTVSGDLPFEPVDGTPDGPYGDIVYLTQGPDGALYYVDLGYSDTTGQTGISKIRRIRFLATDQPPTAIAAAQPTEGLAPLNVSFSSAGSADPEGSPLTFNWDFGDGATSTAPNPAHLYTNDGRYTAHLSVSDGTNTTLAPSLTISVGNRPVPTIATPANGLVFRAGEVIAFSGDATDVEDGVLPPSAFTWNIDFLHEGHVHPGLPQTGTKAGTYAIPTAGHDFSGNTRYRITLTVTDTSGLQNSQSVLIYPRKVNVTFGSAPSGLALSLDGIPHTTPFVYDTLVGFTHVIDAPNQSDANLYTFASWSDGGAQSHPIVVPETDTSRLATYTVTQNPLPSGLVAGYRFSEGTGATTADLSANNNTGTLAGGPVWAPGKYGGGLAFQGVNYVDLGNAASLQLTGSMTLTAWINISAQPGDDGAIIAKLGPAGWQLKTSPDTGPRTAAIQISGNGSDSIQRYSTTVLTTNTWYHVAGAYDAAARTLSIYVNGLLNNGVLSGTVPAAQYNAPVNVNIAQRTGAPGLFNFLGTIDEAHVFNRALTPAEIQTDMNTPR